VSEGSQDGEDYQFESTAPANLSETEMARCVAIVGGGGAVTEASARDGLARSSAVVVVRQHGEIIAVGAVKRALKAYVDGVSRKADHAIGDAEELGYVAVDLPHRGQHLSSRIVRSLKEAKGGRLFGTTDDERMKVVLTKAGFQRKGKEWKGNRGDLSLWLSE